MTDGGGMLIMATILERLRRAYPTFTPEQQADIDDVFKRLDEHDPTLDPTDPNSDFFIGGTLEVEDVPCAGIYIKGTLYTFPLAEVDPKGQWN